MMNLPGGAARAAILASTVVKDSPRPHTHQRICFISVAAGGTDERRFRATARVAFGSGESRAALPDNPRTGPRDASRRLFITVSGSSRDLRRLLSTSRRGFRGHFASFAWRTNRSQGSPRRVHLLPHRPSWSWHSGKCGCKAALALPGGPGPTAITGKVAVDTGVAPRSRVGLWPIDQTQSSFLILSVHVHRASVFP